jgi:hypothetical protein
MADDVDYSQYFGSRPSQPMEPIAPGERLRVEPDEDSKYAQYFSNKRPPPPEPARTIAPVEAGGYGVANGLTFGTAPAIAGLAEASGIPSVAQAPNEIDFSPIRPVVGAAKLLHNWLSEHPDQAVREAYERGRKSYVKDQKAAQEQHFWPYLAGQFGGALATPAGVGSAATGAMGRIGLGALGGGIGGGLYGAGEAIGQGEGWPEIGTEGAKGAAVGTVFGGAGAAGGNLAEKAYDTWSRLYHGVRDVDTEAGRQVVNALAKDYEKKGAPNLTPEEKAVGNEAGAERAVLDAGGENTRELARTAANTSPTARAALEETVQPRFEQQSERISNYIRDKGAGGAHAADDVVALEQAARKANRPAYQRAYAAGNRDLWSDEIERLTSAPAVKQAMQDAANKWKDWQVVDGFGAMRPGATHGPGGMVNFTPGRSGVPAFPNIQLFDYTARNLADKAKAAGRAGETHLAAQYGSLERQLKAELDRQVPEYKQARAGAHAFFRADNALDSGRNFVMQNSNMRDAARALAKMKDPERELFARGFASELADKIAQVNYNRNVVNSAFLNNPAAREKIHMALGTDRARQIEALLRVENLLQQGKNAITGNSTTARQLAGMAGHGVGAGLAVTAVEGLSEHGVDPKTILLTALGAGGAKHIAQRIDSRVASRVGEMLASQDPAILSKGLQIVSKQGSPFFEALRHATGAGARVAAQDIGPTQAAAGAAALGNRAMHMFSSDEGHGGHGHDALIDQMQP